MGHSFVCPHTEVQGGARAQECEKWSIKERMSLPRVSRGYSAGGLRLCEERLGKEEVLRDYC